MGINNTIAFLCSWLPFILVAWAYVRLVDPSTSFWSALLFLLAVRLFFSIVELLGRVLAWRIHGRRHAIRTVLAFMQANGFPMRKYVFDDAATYLFRLRDPLDTPGVSDQARGAARQLEGILDFLDEVTMLHAWRARSAFESALDIYAPREKALHKDFEHGHAVPSGGGIAK